MNINKIIIGGRLTSDTELKSSTNNTPIVNFSVAVNRRKDGTDFIECVAFNKTAENINKYFHKGSGIIVFGSLNVSTYKDKDGNNRKVTKVIVNEFDFVDKKEAETSLELGGGNDDYFSDIQDTELPF